MTVQYDPDSKPSDMTFKYYNADEVRRPFRCAQEADRVHDSARAHCALNSQPGVRR